MPSWGIHLVTANKIEKQNEFTFANIMPDILHEDYYKSKDIVIKNYKTHYPFIKQINGISIPLPDIDYFKNEYKNKMNNPVIRGYYCHLVTDYFWNTYTYGKYFKSFDKEKNLVEIQLNNGSNKILTWDEAIREKQRDFIKLADYIKKEEKIVIPKYTENIEKYSEEIKEFKFTPKDIITNIEVIKQRIFEQENDEEYSIFTREEFLKILTEGINFVKEKLEE